MHTCLGCEITRAKVYALGFLTVGKTLEQAAEWLSAKYAARYYVEDNTLWRDTHPKAMKIYGKDSV